MSCSISLNNNLGYISNLETILMSTNNHGRFTTPQLDLFLEQGEYIAISHAMIFEHFVGSSSAVFKYSSCDGNGYPLSPGFHNCLFCRK